MVSQGTLVSQTLKTGQNLSPGGPRWQLCWSFSLLVQEFMIPVPQMACITHKSFPLHEQQVQQVPSLAGCLTSWVGKFSSTHSRHSILDISALWEQGPAIVRLLPDAYRVSHLPLHPGWVVSNRFLPGYLPVGLSLILTTEHWTLLPPSFSSDTQKSP